MENKSCTSCKLISISCLTGIGIYLIKTAKNQNRNSRMVLTTLGLGNFYIIFPLNNIISLRFTGSCCLGIGEIFDKSPFRT